MTTADETPSRLGSSQDLARRMDRMEQKHEELAKEVTALTATVGRVEQNQTHVAELNRLRFDALDTGQKSLAAQLTDFIRRVEGMISGEVETTQARQGRELVTDYQHWRATVEDRLDSHDTFETQGRLLGRITLVLIGGNAIAIIAAIAAIAK